MVAGTLACGNFGTCEYASGRHRRLAGQDATFGAHVFDGLYLLGPFLPCIEE